MADEATVTTTETTVDAPVTETPAAEPEKPSLESLYDIGPPTDEIPAVDEADGDASAATDDKGKGSDSGTAVTATSRIDVELLAQAEAWDIPREWAEKVGEVALSKELNRLWARNAVQNARHEKPQRQENDPASKERTEEMAELDKLIADPEYAPEMKAFAKSHKAALQREEARDREVYAMRDELMRRDNAALQADVRTKTDEFDQLIAAIEAPELFGSGGYSDMSATKEQETNRYIVAWQVDMLERSYLELGQKPPEVKELFRRVVQAQFPDNVQTKAQQHLAEQVSSRAKQAIARPSPRKAGARTPDQLAVAAVRDKMRELGRPVDDAEGDFQQF